MSASAWWSCIDPSAITSIRDDPGGTDTDVQAREQRREADAVHSAVVGPLIQCLAGELWTVVHHDDLRTSVLRSRLVESSSNTLAGQREVNLCCHVQARAVIDDVERPKRPTASKAGAVRSLAAARPLPQVAFKV
ncbi:MAG: hypothetical protein ACI8QZ_003046 [Chlamydiales bacterium]